MAHDHCLQLIFQLRMIYEVERSVFAFPFFIPHNMFWTPKKKQQLSSPRIGASVTDIHKMIIVTSAASEYSCIRVSLREISSSCANGKVGVFYILKICNFFK